MGYLGMNIKKIRERWDLSQQEFGLLIGATRGMIMQYEKRGTMPKNETVSQLIRITGLSLNMLDESILSDDEIPEMSQEDEVLISNFRDDPDSYELDERDIRALKTVGQRQKTIENAEYVSLLKSNDAFFKGQYSAFNAQVLANLTALVSQAKNLEALIKISLEHTGNIEAHQLGIAPAEIHDKINKDVLAAAGVEIDNGVDTPRRG